MTCTVHRFTTPDGSDHTVIACGSGRRRREACDIPGCPKAADALCDYPIAGESRTCDKKLCRNHRKQVGPNRDYCPEHLKAAWRGR